MLDVKAELSRECDALVEVKSPELPERLVGGLHGVFAFDDSPVYSSCLDEAAKQFDKPGNLDPKEYR